jgi:uncharacterized membrane protein
VSKVLLYWLAEVSLLLGFYNVIHVMVAMVWVQDHSKFCSVGHFYGLVVNLSDCGFEDQ